MRQAPLSASLGVAWDHPRVLVCLLVTLLALPVLLATTHVSGSHSPSFEVSTAAANEGRSASTQGVVHEVSERLATTTVPATTAPAATAPSTAAATTQPQSTWTEPASTAPPTTVWTPPATTAPPATAWTPPPTTAPQRVAAVAQGHSESGLATYYAHNPSGCASRTVPRGTTVTVTASNGASITCTVDDYGPFGEGRIIDLSEQGFAKLASLGTGVISVTVTW
jgi:rare lipoprotein A (peptidoglycan hydrolase)